MEKDLFAGVQLMAVKPEEQKRKKVIVMQPRKSEIPAYDPQALKDALEALRDFVAFDMAAELSTEATITAWRLSSELMPLDYLIREVEFKEVEVLV